MAPELRKRKPVAEPVKSTGAKAAAQKKTTAQTKRKAAEESSPVSLKKQKPVKKAAAEPTPKEDTPKKVSKDDKLQLSDSEDEEDEDHVQALAHEVDSEDEDAQASNGKSDFKPGQDVGKIPKPAEETKSVAPSGEPGVIYIGRIPHGFYEHEMKQYFAQFGPISKLRLSRNKKTGASKHFAFVEFAEASTAEIVAKTMDNYLLFGHILKCKTIPKSQVHDDLFRGSNRRFKKVPWNKMAGKELEKPLGKSTWEGKVNKEKKNREDKAAKLAAIGYDFEAPALKDVPDVEMVEAADANDAKEEKEEKEEEEEVEIKTQKSTKKKGGKKK